MRPAAWAVLGVVALLAAGALLLAAFTRFSGGPEPPQGDPAYPAYQEARYHEARLSVLLGLAASFALLGGAACLQRARRTRSSP
jgi:hypothetical protein